MTPERTDRNTGLNVDEGAIPASPTSTQRGNAALVLGLACMAASLWQFSRIELIDDAYISFRYAENLVAGHGLVFNVGERVEGYTNFLWVMLLAAVDFAGLSLESASRWLGAMFALLTVWALWTFDPVDVGKAWWQRIVPVLFLLANTAFSMWAVHGLETALFCFWLTMGIREESRGIAGPTNHDDSPAFRTRAGLWFALAALTRPEGLLMFAAVTGIRFLSSPKRWISCGGWRPLAVFSVLVGTHLLWRWNYYGYPLPNTYYAKVGMTSAVVERGWEYVVSFFWEWRNAVLLIAVLPLFSSAGMSRFRFLWAMLLFYSLIIVLEGGDAFPGYRFMVPICPVLYLLVAEGLAVATQWGVARWRRFPGLGTSVSLALLGAAGHGFHVYDSVYYESREENDFTHLMKQVGRALGDHFPSGTTIALNPVGAVPYFSRFHAYDMLGLTNEHIAHTEPPDLGKGQAGHEKGDGSFILDQLPDLILFGNVMILDDKPVDPGSIQWRIQSRSEREMAGDPRLTRLYRPLILPLGDDRYLAYLQRQDPPATGSSTKE